MDEREVQAQFRVVGDGSGVAPSGEIYAEELQLALRNRGMPLEALNYDITPTGLHYLLVHFDIPATDESRWRLRLGGRVARPLTLTLDEIRQRPRVTHAVTMECAGNGRARLSPRPVSQPWLVGAIGTARWTGTPLWGLLQEARLAPEACELVFRGADRGVQGQREQTYARSLQVDEAMREEVLVAYEMNGEPLQPQHGYPLRLVVPGWYGMTNVKWLQEIEAVDRPFEGYQMTETYRYADSGGDQGEPVKLMKVRALMIPPGIPDFMTRTRLLKAGPVTLHGRAWAGRRDVVRVEVSVDGASWHQAELGAPVSPHAWRLWSWSWQAEPGHHTLAVRGTDAKGQVQPMDQPWNVQGMGNNMCQRVDVIVE